MRKVLQLRPMIPVMKHLIADARRDPAWRRVRPPLLPLPDVEARALESELCGARLADRSPERGAAPDDSSGHAAQAIRFSRGAVCELHDLIEDQIFGIMAAPGDGSSDPASGLQAVHMPWVLNRAVGRCGALAGACRARQSGVDHVRARARAAGDLPGPALLCLAGLVREPAGWCRPGTTSRCIATAARASWRTRTRCSRTSPG